MNRREFLKIRSRTGRNPAILTSRSPSPRSVASCLANASCTLVGAEPLAGANNNVKLYPTFQEYFRKSKPPLLAIWGKHDPFFIPPGAEAYRRDNPNATVQFLNTGHFALETHVEEIALAMRQLLSKTGG